MNSKKNFFTGLMLLLGIANIMGQPTMGVQREVSYSTSTYKTFKIPCDVEFGSLSPLDFVYLQAKPALIRQMQFFIENNKLTITHTSPHLPRYERDYEFQMGKSVTDEWGTRLYYHNGEEYYNLPNEEENEGFTISDKEIETYGFFNGLFNVSIDEIQAFCDSVGIPYYIWGQKVLIIYADSNERTETETDLEQLSIETRLYQDDVHILTDRTEYQRTAEDWIIPAKKIHVHYSELPSETRYQITQVETYLSYRVVDENGDFLVNMENKIDIDIDSVDFLEEIIGQYQIPVNVNMTVAPNPVQDQFTVSFSEQIDAVMNIKIMDIMGTKHLDVPMYVFGNQLQIDNINHLPTGIYYIFCINSEWTGYTQFIKN